MCKCGLYVLHLIVGLSVLSVSFTMYRLTVYYNVAMFTCDSVTVHVASIVIVWDGF